MSDDLRQVMIRTSPEDHERWKQAAERNGQTLSDFARQTLNAAATEILDCQHKNTISYPWSEICKDCNHRLRP